MTVRHYIILILCLGLSLSGFSQKEKKKAYKSKQPQSEQLLDRARAIKDKSPTEAIKLIEQAINSSRRKKSKRRVSNSEAYILLGSIYEQIEQYDLAAQRYQQAFNDFGKKDFDQRAEVLYFIGRVLLKQGKLDEAASSFNTCITETNDKGLKLKCEEGLADIEILRKDTVAVAAILDSIDATPELDSLTFARNEARRSQVLLQQNKYSEASEKFKNSLNTIPRNQQINETDYAPIQQAQEELLNYTEGSVAEKIEIQANAADNAARNFSTETQVAENLKIAELYEAENNYPEAEKFIAVSKALINPNTDAAIAAEIYKKSSDLNQRKGAVEAALDDLEKYIAAKEIAIRNEEQELKTQVEIVKGQKQIDLSQKDFDIEEKDQALLESQLQTQQIIIGLLSLVLIGSLVFFYFLYKNVKAKRKANQLLLLKSLRTQMNPHFIFNALNSVNNFIAKNDEKAANKFLSEFSKLMRKVLDYSQKDFISFEEEMELNQLYLKLEHYRFRDKFEYTFENEAKQNGFNIDVPPMLIQPFIENAVWHGLRYKETPGQLAVKIFNEQDHLVITIQDNGIGRAKSKALKTNNQKQYKSTGLDNVSKRIALINEIYSKNYKIEVKDQDPQAKDVGTFVKIWIPVDH